MRQGTLLVLGALGLVAYYVSKKGALGLASDAIFGGGGSKDTTAKPAQRTGPAATQQKAIIFISPTPFQEIDRNGFVGTDEYDLTFDLVNGTSEPWKGILTAQTVEDSGDLPVTTDMSFGTMEVPAYSTVRKTVTVKYHGYWLNFGTTSVEARVKLATVDQSVSFSVD